jgi:hypothetical protein
LAQWTGLLHLKSVDCRPPGDAANAGTQTPSRFPFKSEKWRAKYYQLWRRRRRRLDGATIGRYRSNTVRSRKVGQRHGACAIRNLTTLFVKTIYYPPITRGAQRMKSSASTVALCFRAQLFFYNAFDAGTIFYSGLTATIAPATRR